MTEQFDSVDGDQKNARKKNSLLKQILKIKLSMAIASGSLRSLVPPASVVLVAAAVLMMMAWYAALAAAVIY